MKVTLISSAGSGEIRVVPTTPGTTLVQFLAALNQPCEGVSLYIDGIEALPSDPLLRDSTVAVLPQKIAAGMGKASFAVVDHRVDAAEVSSTLREFLQGHPAGALASVVREIVEDYYEQCKCSESTGEPIDDTDFVWEWSASLADICS